MDYVDTARGLLNNAGYQSTAGYGVIPAGNGNEAQLDFVGAPNPETLFKLEHYPKFNNIDPCKEPKSYHYQFQDALAFEFVKASQNGYKRAGHFESDAHLRGQNVLEIMGQIPQSMIPVDDSLDNEFEFDANIINAEATAFDAGYRDYAPNYGLNLQGSETTHLKGNTAGRIITTHKRFGHAPSGYEAGYSSAKTNLTGIMDPPVSF